MKIIFICIGNTCRSPMAEVCAREIAARLVSSGKKLPDITFLSAGVMASSSDDMNRSAKSVLYKKYGKEFFHKPCRLTKELSQSADMIVAMDGDIAMYAYQACGAPREKLYVMPTAVPDPYGMPESVYAECLETISRGVEDILLGIAGSNEDNDQKSKIIMNVSFDTRISVPEDAYVIEATEKECFSSPWSLNDIKALIDDKNGVCVSAVGISEDGKSEEVVGYGSFLYVCDEAFVNNIAVREGFRRLGVGKMIVSRLISEAEKLGIVSVHLEVRKSNVPAQTLYLSCGFVTDGERKNFYRTRDGGRENAVLMSYNF